MVASSMLFAGCSETIDNPSDSETGTGLPPVETNQANTNYKPAFAGQTRVNGVKTLTPYKSSVLSSSLSSPWGITALPDGRLLITEKGGTMRIATATGSVSNPFTGLPCNGGRSGQLMRSM